MQDKSSRTKPVVVGFSLGILLICAVAFVAYFSVQATKQEFARSSHDVAALIHTASALHQFDEAQIATLRLRETNEERFMDTIYTHIRKAEECMCEVQNHTYIGADLETTKTLVNKFQIFAKHCKDDFVISEQIKRTTESTDEWRGLSEMQQTARERQDELVEEIKQTGDGLLASQIEWNEQCYRDMEDFCDYMKMLFLITIVVATMLGTGTCTVVACMIGRKSLPFRSDDFSYSEPSADMRVIADRLQEVVNLLRK